MTPSSEVNALLKIPDLKTDVLKKLGVVQNVGKGSLHFPLRNVAGICTGERILYYDRDFEEETLPSEKCSGVLCHSNPKATKVILVLSVLDFLALTTQKLDDCEYFLFSFLNYFVKFVIEEISFYLELAKDIMIVHSSADL